MIATAKPKSPRLTLDTECTGLWALIGVTGKTRTIFDVGSHEQCKDELYEAAKQHDQIALIRIPNKRLVELVEGLIEGGAPLIAIER